MKQQRLGSVCSNDGAEPQDEDKGGSRLSSPSQPHMCRHSLSSITTSRPSCSRGWSRSASPLRLLPFFTNCTAGAAPAARNWFWKRSRSTSDSPGFGLDSILMLELPLWYSSFQPCFCGVESHPHSPKAIKMMGPLPQSRFSSMQQGRSLFSVGLSELHPPHSYLIPSPPSSALPGSHQPRKNTYRQLRLFAIWLGAWLQ
jgi:hypothetical protein